MKHFRELGRLFGLVVVLLHVVQSVHADGICSSAAFQALPVTSLGSSPLQIRTLVQDKSVCLEFTLSSSAPSTSGWFAVGLAQSSSMVNSPTSNCMVYQSAVGTPESYVLGSYSMNGIYKEDNQTFFSVANSSTSPLKFAYERQLSAQSQYDVPIDTTKTMRFIWAYGKSWPISGHSRGTFGIETYNFASGTSSSTGATDGFCDGKNCSAIFGAIALGIMMLCGFVLTTMIPKSRLTEVIFEKTLTSPPVKSVTNAPVPSPWVSLLQNIADLRVGEALVILVFLAAVVMIPVLSNSDSIQVITGKIALLVLMFLVLPISKIPLWSILFNGSFERIVKFHRWLGLLLVIAGLVHAVLALPETSLFSLDKYNNVVPLWGALSNVSFVLLAITANKYVRRMFFEVFYISHRILSTAAFIFTILHSVRRVGVGLAVPLVFYVVGLLDQWRRSYLSSYQADISADGSTGTTMLVLARNKKITQYAHKMNMCSYFWVRVPAISSYEWHPFSAIVSPQGDSIGFCVRAAGASNTFTQRLHAYAKTEGTVDLNLCGPFGKVGLDVTKYDTVILVAGGVGITPLLSAINQRHFLDSLKSLNANWHVLWSVREPQDLLMAKRFMPSEDSVVNSIQEPFNSFDYKGSVNVTWHCHCSNATVDGQMECEGGNALHYRGGMPVLDEYINTSRWVGQKVAVLACGPPTMTVAAQALARECGFAFHKEVFSW